MTNAALRSMIDGARELERLALTLEPATNDADRQRLDVLASIVEVVARRIADVRSFR